ncbi:hypothetical protein R1T16_14060 [Flavobacterium sp. DG1-102-2]|uniref:hypothetical protein n=1 Tax=Flavobacterium sp. DG1-102-2 TaxID=3081663 RepID=UPI002949581E|nr:hypothetical protein [Flavobacterium sp. DG1-102-2]MDV6169556.1 hypothetical protein [Flavobacterium sp. DG1-102-2]
MQRKTLELKESKPEVSIDENGLYNQENFKDIEGNILILKYENIINLSLSFIATDILTDINGEIVGVEPRLIG